MQKKVKNHYCLKYKMLKGLQDLIRQLVKKLVHKCNVSKNGKKVLGPIIVCNKGYWITSDHKVVSYFQIFQKSLNIGKS